MAKPRQKKIGRGRGRVKRKPIARRSPSASSYGSIESDGYSLYSDVSMPSVTTMASSMSRDSLSPQSSRGSSLSRGDYYTDRYDDSSIDPLSRKSKSHDSHYHEIKTNNGLKRLVHATIAKLKTRGGCPMRSIRKEIRERYGYNLTGQQNTKRLNNILKSLTTDGKLAKTPKGYSLPPSSQFKLGFLHSKYRSPTGSTCTSRSRSRSASSRGRSLSSSSSGYSSRSRSRTPRRRGRLETRLSSYDSRSSSISPSYISRSTSVTSRASWKPSLKKKGRRILKSGYSRSIKFGKVKTKRTGRKIQKRKIRRAKGRRGVLKRNGRLGGMCLRSSSKSSPIDAVVAVTRTPRQRKGRKKPNATSKAKNIIGGTSEENIIVNDNLNAEEELDLDLDPPSRSALKRSSRSVSRSVSRNPSKQSSKNPSRSNSKNPSRNNSRAPSRASSRAPSQRQSTASSRRGSACSSPRRDPNNTIDDDDFDL